MLISHQFDAEKHLYLVPKQFVMSTSSVIALNGLSDYGPVPKVILSEASERGTAIHKMIQCYETGKPFAENEFHQQYFDAYLRFKEDYGFKPTGTMERSCVYQHQGTEVFIGGTPDMTGFIDGKLFVVDIKTNFPTYGMAKKQKLLAWRLQTQSYAEIFEADDVPNINRAVVHCHPECGKIRGQKPSGYEFHPFQIDDQHNWDSAIRMAFLKLANGFKLEER